MPEPPPLPISEPSTPHVRLFGWLAAVIVVPLVFSFLATSVLISGWYAVTRHSGSPPDSVLFRAMLYGTPLGLWASVVLLWVVRRRTGTFLEVFDAASAPKLADVGSGLLLAFAWVSMYHFGEVVRFGNMIQWDLAKLSSLPLSLSAGLCEEFLYRGFLIVLMARAGFGAPLRVTAAAIAFGIGHIMWGPAGMFWTAMLGLTFGALVVWRGNVWPAVIAHSVLNLFIEPALMQQAFGVGS